MFLIPLEGVGGDASRTAAYLMVPPSTAEYRFDVTAYAALVTLRVWTDPRESARYTRMHAEGFKLPILALGLSATYLAPFRDARSTAQDAILGYTTTPQAAYGAKLCLDVLPNGRILPDRAGGCALALTLWRRGAGRNFFTLGIEPELVVVRGSLYEIAVSPQLALGNTTGGRPYANYVFYGLGASYTATLAGFPRLGFQVQANLLNLDSKSDAPDPGRVYTLTMSLAAGVLLKL
jgi:hypothetical protein